MDALSGASSVFAVASIAIQLGQSIKQLVDFWKAVQDAPHRINKLFGQLDLLHSILKQTEGLGYHHFDDTVAFVLLDCYRKVEDLEKRIRFAKGSGKEDQLRRKWSAFKITLKTDEIKDLQKSIEEAKSSLQVVLLNSVIKLVTSSTYDQQHSSAEIKFLFENMRTKPQIREERVVNPPLALRHPQQNGFMLVSGDPADCCESEQKSQNDESSHHLTQVLSNTKQLSKSILLEDRVVSKEYSLRNLQMLLMQLKTTTINYQVTIASEGGTKNVSEQTIEYVLRPTAFGRLLGICQGLVIRTTPRTNWQYVMHPIRVVPGDSLIFEFCREGNLDGVRTLLKRGEASLTDRDPNGRSPLRVAADCLQVKVAGFLLQEGADPYEQDWDRNRNMLESLAMGRQYPTLLEQKVAMINLLQKHAKDGYDSKIYCDVMCFILLAYRPAVAGDKIALTALQCEQAAIYLLGPLLSSVGRNHPALSQVLSDSMHFYYGQTFTHWLLENMRGPLFTVYAHVSIIHQAFVQRLPELDPYSMRIIIQRTENLHLAGPSNTERQRAKERTPTMMAMYEEGLFRKWVEILKDLGHNMEEFVSQEIEEGQLAEVGWTKDSLMVLFEGDIVPNPFRGLRHNGFPYCERCGYCRGGALTHLKVDLSWRQRLRYIRKQFARIEEVSGVVVTREFSPVSQPYRMVCADFCQDKICVAWLYENDQEEEPAFPPYPFQEPKALKCGDEEGDCPTANMPGYFKE